MHLEDLEGISAPGYDLELFVLRFLSALQPYLGVNAHVVSSPEVHGSRSWDAARGPVSPGRSRLPGGDIRAWLIWRATGRAQREQMREEYHFSPKIT